MSYLQQDLLSLGHGKILASIKDKGLSTSLAEMAVEQEWSVRELEKRSKQSKSVKDKEAFDSTLYEAMKQKMEEKTGFHFDMKLKNKSKGEVRIKFGSTEEFNDICALILNRRS